MFAIDEVILRLHTRIFLFYLKPLMTRLISCPWKYKSCFQMIFLSFLKHMILLFCFLSHVLFMFIRVTERDHKLTREGSKLERDLLQPPSHCRNSKRRLPMVPFLSVSSPSKDRYSTAPLGDFWCLTIPAV